MIAWSSKVSSEFLLRLVDICCDLSIEPDWLMACMAFETGGKLSASVRNRVSGATGLIQFMASTAHCLDTSCERLAEMTPEDQLEYVHRYFLPYRGKINSLEDCYMAILWPRGIGKPGDYVLFQRDAEAALAYKQNRGLDSDSDGRITKAEACEPVRKMLRRGLEMPNGKPWED